MHLNAMALLQSQTDHEESEHGQGANLILPTMSDFVPDEVNRRRSFFA